MMRKEEIGGNVVISNGVTVKYKIKRNGQQYPSLGNNVKVLLSVGLPTEQYDYLVTELCFGNNAKFCNNTLNALWGHVTIADENNWKQYRAIQLEFIAATWKAAFAVAEDFLEKEINTLEGFVQIRLQALINAELDEDNV